MVHCAHEVVVLRTRWLAAELGDVSRRFLLSAVSTTLLAMLMTGCGKPAPPETESPVESVKRDRSIEASHSLPDSHADSHVSPTDLFDAYIAGDGRRYEGQVLEIKGRVYDFARADDGTALLNLETGKRGVLPCRLRDREFPWRKVLPTQSVTLRGRWTDSFSQPTEKDRDLHRLRVVLSGGYDPDFAPTISDCEVVSAEGARCPTISAVQMASEVDADREDALDRYSGGPHRGFCVVSGEVSSIEDNEEWGSRTLLFKHFGMCRLTVTAAERQTPQIADVVAGNTINLLAIATGQDVKGEFRFGFVAILPP